MRVVSVVVLAACSSGSDKSAPSVALPRADAAIADAARADTKAEQTSPPDDPKARAAYGQAMSKGRKATDAKRYADALAAFDAALEAKPNDARALAERGYARLVQATDLDAASGHVAVAITDRG